MQEDIKKRGISQKAYDFFGLYVENNKLHIPIYSPTGEKLFEKIKQYSGIAKYTHSITGATGQLYCAHRLKGKKEVIITEGELDALVMWSNGYAAVSSTTGALSEFKDEWIELLKNKKIYICYDNDSPGRKGAEKLKTKIPSATILHLKDVKDISEYYEKYGEVKSIFNLIDKNNKETAVKTIKPTKKIKDEKIIKAKEIPLGQICQFNKENKTRCIFHNEKTASLAWNKKTNTYKCFGCGEFGDSISLYQKINNVDFRTALNALNKNEITKKPAPILKKEQNIEFLLTEGGKVRKIGTNIQKIFDNDPSYKDILRYDIFHGEFQINTDRQWRPLENHLIRQIINKIQTKYPFFDVGMDSIIKDIAIATAEKNTISPPLEYIKSIKWDGQYRLKSWLSSVYGVPQNEYYEEIGEKWIVGMTKRIAQPGSQFDHVLVTEGQQGFGKSTILRNLCAFGEQNYFSETTETPDSGKELALTLKGNIVVEFAEGAITKYTDQQKIKSFITRTEDNYRTPYMKNATKYPRQCVFAMTINDSEYLRDKTGERRYWLVSIPINKKLGDWEWVKENKDQLFAEAYTKINEPYKFMSKGVLEYWEELVGERKQTDPVEEYVVNWYNSLLISFKKEGVSVVDVKTMIRKDENMREFMTKYLDKEISNIFTNVLKLKKVRKNKEEKWYRLYMPTELTPMIEGIENNKEEEW